MLFFVQVEGEDLLILHQADIPHCHQGSGVQVGGLVFPGTAVPAEERSALVFQEKAVPLVGVAVPAAKELGHIPVEGHGPQLVHAFYLPQGLFFVH